ncbi:MAG: hypothetical protein LBC19_05230 [Tannerella sp.]|jgi:hypothetical protein|nr:hypothetical protein [Tannerella sp.]
MELNRKLNTIDVPDAIKQARRSDEIELVLDENDDFVAKPVTQVALSDQPVDKLSKIPYYCR